MPIWTYKGNAGRGGKTLEGLFASGSPLWLILGIACFVFGGYGYYKSRKGKTKEQYKAEQRAVSKKFEERISHMNETQYERIQRRDRIKDQRRRSDPMTDAAEVLAERQANAKRKKK